MTSGCWRLALLAMLLGAGFPTLPSRSAEPKVHTLIDQLDNPSFSKRLRIAQQIKARGETALPALTMSKKHPNPEIALRVHDVIDQIIYHSWEPVRQGLHIKLESGHDRLLIGKNVEFRVVMRNSNVRSLSLDTQVEDHSDHRIFHGHGFVVRDENGKEIPGTYQGLGSLYPGTDLESLRIEGKSQRTVTLTASVRRERQEVKDPVTHEIVKKMRTVLSLGNFQYVLVGDQITISFDYIDDGKGLETKLRAQADQLVARSGDPSHRIKPKHRYFQGSVKSNSVRFSLKPPAVGYQRFQLDIPGPSSPVITPIR